MDEHGAAFLGIASVGHSGIGSTRHYGLLRHCAAPDVSHFHHWFGLLLGNFIMENVVIVSATRTAVGSFNGSLSSISAVSLGEIVIREALKRASVDVNLVDEVIMGNVLQAGLGQTQHGRRLLRPVLGSKCLPIALIKYVDQA